MSNGLQQAKRVTPITEGIQLIKDEYFRQITSAAPDYNNIQRFVGSVRLNGIVNKLFSSPSPAVLSVRQCIINTTSSPSPQTTLAPTLVKRHSLPRCDHCGSQLRSILTE